MASNTEMVTNYTPLSQINKNRIDWNIRVRVCRKWKTTGNGRIPQTLEFLFVDKEGTRIQASVRNFLIYQFDNKMIEGELLSISQFSVVDSQKNFPITDHPYRIIFQRNTFLATASVPNFPKTLFKFKSFVDIKESIQKADGPLFDVIGQVIDLKDIKLKEDPLAKANQSIHLLLKDLDENKIECVLWEPYCKQMNRFVESVRNRKSDKNVVIIQLCRTKILFQGAVGISNTYHATRVITDQNFDDIVEFRNKLPDDDVSLSFDGSMISSSSYVSVRDELQNSDTIVLCLKDLKSEKKVGKYWIVGSISEIFYDRGWCYNSCFKCKKKVAENESGFFCDNCSTNVSVNVRYKIHAQFVDGDDNVVLLLWNDVVASLIGKAAAAISVNKIVETHTILDVDGNQKDEKKIEIPQPVDDLIGKELMFRVSLETKHIEGTDSVYSVDKYSDDAHFLKKHKKTDHRVVQFFERKDQDVVRDTHSSDKVSSVRVKIEDEFKSPEYVKHFKRPLEILSDDDLPDEQGSTNSKLKMNHSAE